MVQENFSTKESIKNHVIERLVPGESDKEASMQIINIVERSSQGSFVQNLAEWSHSIGNTFRNIKNSVQIFSMEL